MGRWEPDARERLERAALQLFAEQGFADTTVPQITARAGLTTRTFFRHFVDKREVLFAGEDDVPALIAAVTARAPAQLGPLALVVQGLPAFAAEQFQGRREQLLARRRIIETDEGLRERDLRKQYILSDAITQGLRDRGVDPVSASLAARIAVSVMNVSLTRWLDQDPAPPLADVVLDTLRALTGLTADLTMPR